MPISGARRGAIAGWSIGLASAAASVWFVVETFRFLGSDSDMAAVGAAGAASMAAGLAIIPILFLWERRRRRRSVGVQ